MHKLTLKMQLFKNRIEAGIALARKLILYKDREDVLVLAFRKDSLPIAYIIAKRLIAVMDIFLLSNIRINNKKSITVGTIASAQINVFNDGLLRNLELSDREFQQYVNTEREKLNRKQIRLRGNIPYPELKSKVIIVVDDCMARIAKIRAVVTALRKAEPKNIILAVPAVPPEKKTEIEAEVDQLVTIAITKPRVKISELYQNFPRVSDSTAQKLLKQ